MLEVARSFESVANIQNSIRNCKNREIKLQRIIDNLNYKKIAFEKMDSCYEDLIRTEEILLSYESSFLFKYLTFLLNVLPSLKNRYIIAKNDYSNSLKAFEDIASQFNITDVSNYFIHLNNFNRHYSKLHVFQELLENEICTKNKLKYTLDNLKVRIFDKYLADLSPELVKVARNMPSEQVLILKDFLCNTDLDTFDLSSLKNLKTSYHSELKNLKNTYEKLSSVSASFSKACEAMVLYKKSVLKREKLTLSQKKHIQKAKNFMELHNIKNESELNKKELGCRKQLERICQKVDELTIKQNQLTSLLSAFEDSIKLNNLSSTKSTSSLSKISKAC